MLTATLVSLGVVFIAELGDKSQLITMTYALRYRWWVVLSGVGIAAFVVHGLSVTIGHFVGVTLPQRPIAFAAAIAFLFFAAWTWWGGRGADDGDTGVEADEPRFVLLAVVSSFVLAELGDKTMLATVALASERNWAGVWIGATAGMVLADGVAIAVGTVLHKRLPNRFLHGLASVLFAIFGVWMLLDTALGRTKLALVIAAALAVSIALIVTIRTVHARRVRRQAPPPEPAPEAARPPTGH